MEGYGLAAVVVLALAGVFSLLDRAFRRDLKERVLEAEQAAGNAEREAEALRAANEAAREEAAAAERKAKIEATAEVEHAEIDNEVRRNDLSAIADRINELGDDPLREGNPRP